MLFVSHSMIRTVLVRLLIFYMLLTTAISPPLLAGDAAKIRTESFRLLGEGIGAYRRGETQIAVEALQRSASMALNNFRAHYFLGLALLQDRRYREATGPLEVALDLDPGHLLAHVALGNALLKIGDTDEAQAEFFRSIKLKPDFPPALDGLARVLEARNEIDSAIAGFRRAIKADAGYAEAYTHLGDLHLRQNRIDLAIEALVEAVRIRPDFTGGLNRLALAYSILGMSNEAVATIARAIELQPGSPDHLSTLGRIQLGLGNLNRAEDAFLEALTMDPGWPAARLGQAEIERRRGSYDAAVQELDEALTDDRLDAREIRRINAARSRILGEQANWDALQIRLNDGTATEDDRRTLALMFAERGDYSAAHELQNGIVDTPADREFMAWLHFQTGSFRAARTEYTRLAEQTGSVEAFLNLGVTQARLGRDLEAVDSFQRALEKDPSRREARLYLGNALLRLGREAEAIEIWRPIAFSEKRDAIAERVRRVLERLTGKPLEETAIAEEVPS